MGKSSITILYDNRSYKEGLETGWGFSCLVEHSGETVLFDSGSGARKLLRNLDKLGISSEHITSLVLSHKHWDHTGGLPGILERNKQAKAFFPQSFPEGLKKRLRDHGREVVEVREPSRIGEGIFTTKEFKSGIIMPREIGLVVERPQGVIVVTGCSHPGILKMIEYVKGYFGKNVSLVLGGFHLHNRFSFQVRKIVRAFRRLGVERVAPAHCTGDGAIGIFSREYGGDFLRVGSGLIIDLQGV